MLYTMLKIRMIQKEHTQRTLAEALNVTPCYLSTRMRGKYQFDMDLVYKICDVLDISYTDISVYFPKNGKGMTQAEKERRLVELKDLA